MHGLLWMWAVVTLALAVDHIWGEPPARWHPVVWMGNMLHRSQAWIFAVQGPAALLMRGALAWLALALFWVLVAWGLEFALKKTLGDWPAVGAVVMALLFKPMFAWRMLRTETVAVEAALQQSTAQGREQLARLVSRDVDALEPAQIRESAVESMAENLSDSVFAPLFWFALLGLPGAVLYRFANTADAMWGYPGLRAGRDWRWAGKWAARADDVLSWIPARLTALLLWLFNAIYLRKPWRVLTELPAQARLTPSPNSGWPMAMMALLLDVRLGKPGVYTLHHEGQAPDAHSLPQAARMANRAVLGTCLLTGVAAGIWTWS